MAFGLSTDYEVFLLSRINGEYDYAGDNAAAVTKGLQRSAGIITAAALHLASSRPRKVRQLRPLTRLPTA